MISFEDRGSFKHMSAFLRRMSKPDYIRGVLETCAKEGVAALAAATPVESGLAAQSWDYEIISKGGRYTIWWTNSDIEDGFPVAIALQLGYGTGTGGYVQGRDYINPAIEPVFNRIASTVWKAVTSA